MTGVKDFTLFKTEKNSFAYDLLLQLPAAIAILSGPEHIYQFANEEYCKIAGKADVVGMPGRKALPDSESQGLWDIIDNVYKSGEAFIANEFPVMQDKNGTGKKEASYYNFNFTPFYKNDKEVGGIVIMAIDVSDLVNTRNIVQNSGEQFRFLANNIPIAIWKSSPEGEMIFFNQCWFEYTGLNMDRSRKWEWTSIIHPDERPRYLQHWTKAITHGVPFEFEERLRRNDGEYRWHQSKASAMKNNKGETMMWIGSHNDIHDQKLWSEQLELAVKTRTEELSEAIKELSRSNSDLEQFAYVASHDLKEPIRMVSNYATLLAKIYKGKQDADFDEFIGFITEGARRMQELVEDLLSYSRIEHNDFKTLVDCNKVMDIVKTNLTEKLENTGARLIYDSLPVVPGRETQLVRLFQNLIDNSLKFRSEDKLPEIKISSNKTDEHYLFTLQDNGIGIDPLYEHKIFVIFQRLHSREKYSGTGIGLAVCKKIVELHGGKIWVESMPGQGATFYFTIAAE